MEYTLAVAEAAISKEAKAHGLGYAPPFNYSKTQKYVVGQHTVVDKHLNLLQKALLHRRIHIKYMAILMLYNV